MARQNWRPGAGLCIASLAPGPPRTPQIDTKWGSHVLFPVPPGTQNRPPTSYAEDIEHRLLRVHENDQSLKKIRHSFSTRDGTQIHPGTPCCRHTGVPGMPGTLVHFSLLRAEGGPGPSRSIFPGPVLADRPCFPPFHYLGLCLFIGLAGSPPVASVEPFRSGHHRS